MKLMFWARVRKRAPSWGVKTRLDIWVEWGKLKSKRARYDL